MDNRNGISEDEERRLLDALLGEYRAGRITKMEAARRIEESSPGSVAATLLLSRGAVEELMRGAITVEEAERVVNRQADLHPCVPELFVDCAVVSSRREPMEDVPGYLALAKIKSELYMRSEFLEEMHSEDGATAPLTRLVEEAASRLFVWRHYGETNRDHLAAHFLVQDVASAEERYLDPGEVEEIAIRADTLGPLLAAMCYDLTHIERDPPRSWMFIARLLGELKPPEAVYPMVEALEICEGELLHEAVLSLAKLGSAHAAPVSRRLKALVGDPGAQEARLPAIEALGFLLRREGNLEFLEGTLRALDAADPDFDELYKFFTWSLLRTGLSREAHLVTDSLEARRAELQRETVKGVRRSLDAFIAHDDKRLEDLLLEDVYDLCCGPLHDGTRSARLTMTLIREMAISGRLEEMLEEGSGRAPVPREFLEAGRNEPCPCGSGRKYKKCCLPRVEEEMSGDASRRLVEDEQGSLGRLVDRLILFARSSKSAVEPTAAMNEYLDEAKMRSVSDEEESNSPVPLGQMFADWFVFGRAGEKGETVADEFARVRGPWSLPRVEREMLDAVRGGRFSVYEVLEVRLEQGLRLRDIFRGDILDVREVSATRSLVKWDLLAGRVGPVGDHLEIVSPIFSVPFAIRDRLEKYIKRKAKEAASRGEAEDVGEYLDRKSFMLATYTHKQMRKMHSRVLPTLLSAEGDLVCRCAAYYKVADLDKAQVLLSKHPDLEARPTMREAKEAGKLVLDWFMSPDLERELRAGTHLGPSMQQIEEEDRSSAEAAAGAGDSSIEIGAIRRMFGVLTLSGEKLTLETDSRERLERGKEILAGLLGAVASHRVDSFEDQEVLLRSPDGQSLTEAGPAPRPIGVSRAGDSLDPEVERRIVMEHLKSHYASWPDIPLPALDGKTPREAVRTKSGRRKVNDLLKQFENASERAARAGQPAFDFGVIREELGVPPDIPQ